MQFSRRWIYGKKADGYEDPGGLLETPMDPDFTVFLRLRCQKRSYSSYSIVTHFPSAF